MRSVQRREGYNAESESLGVMFDGRTNQSKPSNCADLGHILGFLPVLVLSTTLQTSCSLYVTGCTSIVEIEASLVCTTETLCNQMFERELQHCLPVRCPAMSV